MPEFKWTPSLIEERFVEAADVMKRLPDVRVPGHFNTWPKMLRQFADLILIYGRSWTRHANGQAG